MSRTRIKVCGITRQGDAEVAVDCGVDSLGFNFYPASPRYVSTGKAASIASQLPAFVNAVGLVVNPTEAEVTEILKVVPLDLLQFHGDETNAFCASFGRRFIKVLRVDSFENLASRIESYPDASAILLDAYVSGKPGGTGETLDWQRLPAISQPLILAGGLRPDNVGTAIAMTSPYAVDVSSGVEAEPGKKSPELVKQFVAAVAAADGSD